MEDMEEEGGLGKDDTQRIGKMTEMFYDFWDLISFVHNSAYPGLMFNFFSK